ncbi:MAG: GrpB family protein [Planctomycetaceae bacterium]|jgi:GrpB-like predicted nucleotidyltransferase (UPF0157 family)
MKHEMKESGLIGGIERREIEIADYDLLWSDVFHKHATLMTRVLGIAAWQIEHIGSTSVPGLGAKPIVDVLLVVEDSAVESSYRTRLEKAGYQLRVCEPDFHEHRMFRTLKRDVHVHVYSINCPEIQWHLTFRNRLRTNPAERRLYEQAKRTLAQQEWTDMNAYAEDKSDIIEHIIGAAQAAGETDG